MCSRRRGDSQLWPRPQPTRRGSSVSRRGRGGSGSKLESWDARVAESLRDAGGRKGGVGVRARGLRADRTPRCAIARRCFGCTASPARPVYNLAQAVLLVCYAIEFGAQGLEPARGGGRTEATDRRPPRRVRPRACRARVPGGAPPPRPHVADPGADPKPTFARTSGRGRRGDVARDPGANQGLKGPRTETHPPRRIAPFPNFSRIESTARSKLSFSRGRADRRRASPGYRRAPRRDRAMEIPNNRTGAPDGRAASKSSFARAVDLEVVVGARR